jgi:hypothetical protein
VRTTTVDQNRTTFSIAESQAAECENWRRARNGFGEGAQLFPSRGIRRPVRQQTQRKRLTLLEVPSLRVQRFSLVSLQGAERGGGNCGLISLSTSKYRTWVRAEKRGGGGRPLADFTGNRRELFEVPLDTYLARAGRETGVQRIPGVTRRAEATAERVMSGTDNNL